MVPWYLIQLHMYARRVSLTYGENACPRGEMCSESTRMLTYAL